MIYINKFKYLYTAIALVTILAFSLIVLPSGTKELKKEILQATVITGYKDKITVKDTNNIIYTFDIEKNNYKAGDNLIIEYTGLLDKNKELQTTKLISISPVSQDEEDIPKTINNMFSQFSTLATAKLKEMSLEEKIGQILLVRYPEENIQTVIDTYKVGGFVFFEKDFQDKTKTEVKNMMNSLQNMSKIPLLTATDEEGGKVVRISSNKNLSTEPFLSPRELYLEGGFSLISKDTKLKSSLLEELGLNLNLAPVIDVSTDENDYIYERTLGEDTELVAEYAKTVIEASKETAVSYVLKHFPGYGNNEDTHKKEVVDTRTYEEIALNDLPPFKSGISAGAEAILVSHNIVKSIDENNPASLSPSIHNLLRNNLGFTGIIITDDLAMKAVSSIEDVNVKALQAGNDIIITTNYQESFTQIKDAVNDGILSEDLIDSVVQRILTWKYAKGLMYNNAK